MPGRTQPRRTSRAGDSPPFDVMHHVSWGSLHLGSKLWRLPVPLVYGPIGGGQTAPSQYRRYFGRDWPVEMLRTFATTSLLRLTVRGRETVRNAAITLVTNSATAQACQRLGARDVRYMLAEGLPQEWIVADRKRPTGTPVVLWVGRLLPRKAPMLALETFAELRRTTHARLVVAGDGPLLPQLREMVQRLGLEEDVELLGRVPWPDMTSLYDAATAFLFTSLRDSSGSQFLEALGRGLPAVALDHHGIGDAAVGSAAVKVPLPAEPRQLPGSWPRRWSAYSATTSGSIAVRKARRGRLGIRGRPNRSRPRESTRRLCGRLAVEEASPARSTPPLKAHAGTV